MTTTRRATSDATRPERRPRRHRGIATALAISSILLGSSTAPAQDAASSRAAAEALFKDALTLIDADSWAAGCSRFEQSFTLHPSRSTMIHIARCRAHEGKIATAWKDYQRALGVEGPVEDAERQRELAAVATREGRAIESRLPWLRVMLTAPPPGAQVLCDGVSLPKDALGRAVPVDPGRREVTVTAPGYRRETRSVLLVEGKTVTVAMTLTGASRPAGWLLPGGIVLAAGGAVALGAGAITGKVSLDLAAAVRERCGGVHCLATDTASRQDVSTAKTLGDVSTASFLVGGTFALAGGTLLLLHLRSGGEARAGEAPAASVQASFGPGQITFSGRF